MTDPRPLIAVGVELVPGEMTRLSVPTRYTEAVHAAGGAPLVLPPIADRELLADLLSRADGLLLPGGDDFDTERIGLGPTHPAATPVPNEKQDYDFELARLALDAGIPVLGICYGAQLLALAEGGTLLQHIPDDRPGAQVHLGGRVHPVEVVAGTKLRAALGVDRVDVVSRHHQAVATTGAGWTVCALDDEGLVEAVERDDHPFAIGVQWHPELSPPGGDQDRLFAALVAAARTRAAARTADSRSGLLRC
jgi:gamma-glutamyl-gamma-aminobutyrate hydrolase PuuD